MHIGRGETASEFDAFDGRDAEHDARDGVFEPVEHGLADADGQTDDGAFHHAAHAVAPVARLADRLPHGRPRRIVDDRKRLAAGRERIGGGKPVQRP